MEQQIAKMRNEFDEMRQDVKEIKDFLKGNQYTKGNSLVDEMHDHETRITIIEKKMTKYTNIIIGLSLGCGASIPGMFKVIYAFITAGK
jgi:hypothetical protein